MALIHSDHGCDVVPWCDGDRVQTIEGRANSKRSSTPEGCDVNKRAVFGVGAALAVILLIKKAQSSEPPQAQETRRAAKRSEMFEKMRAGMEAMPEDFPPVVMFNNVAGIRENTDRILELLETGRSDGEEPGVPTST